MLEINLSEFEDYDQKAIFEYLGLHDDTSYQVSMPKTALAIKSDNYIIYWHYYLAAWSGQLLSEISTQFEYFVPSEFLPVDFLFQFNTTDKEKLSEVLFQVINGCYHDNELYNSFHDKGTIFYENAISDKSKAATWGLIRIAEKYLE